MQHFSKTELGQQVLKDRSIPLNARQRQLLLLIDTLDLAAVNSETKTRIVQPEILDFLYEKGLIYNKNEQDLKTEINHSNESTIINEPHTNQIEIKNTANEIDEIFFNTEAEVALSLEEVKELMKTSLQQYCGLLAKPLITKVEHALNVDMLQQCRIQWITHLQESRIQPNQLNLYLRQINYSLVKITNK